MNADNEIVALQSAGISMRRILLPLLIMALVMTAGNAYLTLEVNPASNRKLNELKTELFSSARALIHVEPRVFNEDFPNVLLYVHEVEPETDTWRRVILFDRTSPGEERLTLARRGRLVAEVNPGSESTDGGTGTGLVPLSGGGSGDLWLLLEDAVTHLLIPNKPETYRVNTNRTQMHRLFSKDDNGQVRVRLGMRERTSGELLQLMRGQDLPPDESQSGTTLLRHEPPQGRQRSAAIEMHKRLAIPTACLAFALIALPLGIGSRAGGRGRGFVISIGVVLVYYVMLNNGELLAHEGRIPPWVGIWLPNIVLALGGLVLMRSMGRWLGEQRRGSGWLASWWRQLRDERRQRRAAGTRERTPFTGSIPIHLQRRRYRSRFPTLLDRYLLRRLAFPLSLVLISTSLLYVVVDLTDHIDEMAKNHAPLDVILGYYWNLIPQTVFDVTPMGLLIAVLILLTMLERRNELTAFKAAGLSLYRLIVPVLLLAAISASGLWVLEESVIPEARRESNRLLDRIKGRETARSYRTTDRFWLMSRDGMRLYNFLRYDVAKKEMIRFTMFRFDEDLRLRFHLSADRLRYEKGAWIADSGWYRTIQEDGSDEFKRITRPIEVGVTEVPSYFGQEYRRPAEMAFNELIAYISELDESGARPVRLIVSLHQKITYPLSAFIMIFLALPFALNRGGQRVSTMQGIALALGLGIGYFLLTAAFGKMGEAGILPPIIGVWTPPLLASLFAINRLTTLRS